MSKRFSAVFVSFCKDDPKAKVYMFEAPYYNRIEVGDRVTVEGGDKEATVIAIESLDLEYSSEKKQFELLQKVTGGVTLPLKKVLSVIRETKIEYDEEENENED